MKQDRAYDFFDAVSKAVILIPVVLVAVMFFHVFGKKPASPLVQRSPVTPSPVLNTFNLTGPLACFAADENASWSAYIENKTIAVIAEGKETDQYLMEADCVYRWRSDSLSGQKFCGISPYVSLAERLLASGMVSLDTVIDSVSDHQNAPIDIGVLKKLIKSCTLKKIEDRSVFEIPKDKVFEEKKGE